MKTLSIILLLGSLSASANTLKVCNSGNNLTLGQKVEILAGLLGDGVAREIGYNVPAETKRPTWVMRIQDAAMDKVFVLKKITNVDVSSPSTITETTVKAVFDACTLDQAQLSEFLQKSCEKLLAMNLSSLPSFSGSDCADWVINSASKP